MKENPFLAGQNAYEHGVRTPKPPATLREHDKMRWVSGWRNAEGAAKRAAAYDAIIEQFPPHEEDEDGNCLITTEGGTCQVAAENLVRDVSGALLNLPGAPTLSDLQIARRIDIDDLWLESPEEIAEIIAADAGLEELGERVSALSHGHAELLNQRNHWQAAYNCLRGSVPWDEIAICADIADAVHTPEAGAVIAWLASHQPKEAQP